MSEVKSLQDKASAACFDAVPEVLETMFFELLVETPRMGAPPAGMLDMARVDFEGSARGHLAVLASPDVSGPLAGAFLAVDEQSAREQNIEFVLGELANMLCGSALGRFQPDGSFRLSTPVAHLGRALAESDRTRSDWIQFLLENGPIFVGLSVEGVE